MKRCFLCLTFSVLMLAQSVFGAQVNILVDGNELSDKGEIIDGRTLVPVREIAEALGADVVWDEALQEVRLYKNVVDITASGDVNADIQREVKLKIGGNKVYINGIETFTLDVPAQIINGKTMIPVRGVSESFGADVSWDDSTKTVSIKKALNDSYSEAKIQNDLIKAAENEVIKGIVGEEVKLVERDQVSAEELDYVYGVDFKYEYPFTRHNKVGLYESSSTGGTIGDMIYDLSEFDENVQGVQVVNGLTITNIDGEFYFSLNELEQLGLIE